MEFVSSFFSPLQEALVAKEENPCEILQAFIYGNNKIE